MAGSLNLFMLRVMGCGDGAVEGLGVGFGIFYIFIQKFDLRHPECGSPYQQKESIEMTVVLFSGFLFS